MSGILFGLGNPLLDISANVTPDYLAKYELKVPGSRFFVTPLPARGLCV